MTNYPLSIRPFGVHAMLIEWPNEVKEAILEDILQFNNYLKSNCLNVEKWEIVPAYNSLTLILREKPIDFNKLKKRLGEWYAARGDAEARTKYLWRLPVCYDLEFGIDLEEVAKKLSLSVEEIIQKHTNHVYTVFGIGFLPGFMYLGGLPEMLEVPRKSTPRLNVEKGAVGMAGKQTGIYPQESPGGWNIIGNCSVPMFNPKSEDPCFVSVGDKVQFYQIEKAEHDLHKIEGEVGIYKLEKIKWDA
jgi:KipI family sensor histidine kinase inhibitor